MIMTSGILNTTQSGSIISPITNKTNEYYHENNTRQLFRVLGDGGVALDRDGVNGDEEDPPPPEGARPLPTKVFPLKSPASSTTSRTRSTHGLMTGLQYTRYKSVDPN